MHDDLPSAAPVVHAGVEPVLGPILRFRGSDGSTARLAATIAMPQGADPPTLAAEGMSGPERIGMLADAEFWSWRFEAPCGAEASYAVGGRRRDFRVPRPDEPLRLAYASCNGSEEEDRAATLPGGRDAMWVHLARRHAEAPMALLLMGGDQIYADALWELPTVDAWSRLGRRRHAAPFEEPMRRELEAHYLATYRAVMAAPEVAEVLATIPSVMMWDDHDIVDGWGSRSDRWQAAPVPLGLFDVARRAFALVQAGEAPRDGHLGWEGSCGPARIVVPDLRSERTRRRVMGPEGHAWLDAALEAPGAPHLLMVSSVPLVNVDLSMAERVLRPLMPIADLYQDDLRDQWMSHAHVGEWAGLMRRLLALDVGGTRVTTLSGEIHLGAHGTATGRGGRVEQLTASGIAHPPPPDALARLYDRLTRRPWRRAGIELAMRPLDGVGRRYLAERNWLEVEARPDGSLDAVLHGDESGAVRLV